MKLLVASDIHGSAYWCRVLMDRIEEESPDRIILLGDLLYHGPRNPLPDEYDPKQVAAMLNSIAERVVAVRGNCDSEVDQMMLEFPCLGDYALVVDEYKTIFATHGHVFAGKRAAFARELHAAFRAYARKDKRRKRRNHLRQPGKHLSSQRRIEQLRHSGTGRLSNRRAARIKTLERRKGANLQRSAPFFHHDAHRKNAPADSPIER